MPSRQAKQNKQNRKSAHKAIKLGKTDKQRKQRLANKVKRDAIHAINPDLKITIIDGKAYIDGVLNEITVVDGQLKDVDVEDFFTNDDGVVEEHIPLNKIQSLIDDGTIIPIDGDTSNAVPEGDVDYDDQCVHGNALSSSCSECWDQQFKDAESYKDDLTPYATGETTAVKPASTSMWDRLKNKWEEV